MKNKILLLTIMTILLLITISVVSAVNIKKQESKQTKISPLFNIRKNKAIDKQKIIDLKEKILDNIFKDRIFLFPRIFYKTDDIVKPNDSLRLKTRGAAFSLCGGDQCASYDTNCFGTTCKPSSCLKACDWDNSESSEEFYFIK